MNKFIEWVKTNIGFDGLLHFFISAILSVILKYIIGILPAILIVLTIGLGKEYYDKKYGTPELKDLILDILGIFVGVF